MWDDDSSREVISPDVLPRWSRGAAADALGDDPLTAPAGRVPFAINSAMNRKVVFTRAPLWALEVDALVVGNNESLSDRSGATGEVFRRAGPELELEVQRLEGCRTGESRLTAGYTLPATHIVHTVGPRYQPRFASAAECALHWCYRSALHLCREHRLRSVALCQVHLVRVRVRVRVRLTLATTRTRATSLSLSPVPGAHRAARLPARRGRARGAAHGAPLPRALARGARPRRVRTTRPGREG